MFRDSIRDGLTVWSAVLGQLRGLLRFGFLPLLVVEVVIFMAHRLAGPPYGSALVLLALLVQLWIACRISVAWQRWLLLDASGDLGEAVPARGLVGRYFRLELALCAMLLLAVSAAGVAALSYTGLPFDDEGGDLTILLLACAVSLALWGLFVCRLLMVFPATAIGDVSFGFRDSWKATTGWTLRIFLAAGLTATPMLLYGVFLMLVGSGSIWADLIALPLNALSYAFTAVTMAGLAALYFARIVRTSAPGGQPPGR